MNTPLNRRDFLKLNAMIGASAMLAYLPLGSAEAAAANATSGMTLDLDGADMATVRLLFGTPTDIARVMSGTWWTMDDAGQVYQYDRVDRVWEKIVVQDDAWFPHDSVLYVTRWRHPHSSSRALLIHVPSGKADAALKWVLQLFTT
jgi:hypothetical protein